MQGTKEQLATIFLHAIKKMSPEQKAEVRQALRQHYGLGKTK
jgi:hypothetical protein